MRIPKLITNYSYMSDPELANMATRTTDALRTNTNFPDLNPDYAEYEPYALDYVAKQGITANRKASELQRKEKDEAREELLKIMRRVANYINNFTSVSSIQLSSGFLPVANPVSLEVPETPLWARIRASKRPGEILLDFAAAARAYDYELQIAYEKAADGQLIWLPAGTNSSSRGNFYAPVQDGVKYHFRVRARNKKGVSLWSPVATHIAQVEG